MKFLKLIASYFLPHPVEERKSDVSGKVEVVYSQGRYMLDSAHVNYSFGGLHKVLQKAFSQFRIRERKIKNALLLGFGSGSAASILQEEYGKDIQMTGVEKDEAVIELARKYFSIDKYRHLSLHCEDAYDFVLRCDQKFDLVVMDVFIDLNVPERFYEEKFISALGGIMSGDGIVFFNVVVHNEAIRSKGAALFRQMNALIGKTEWCRIAGHGTENWVFVADRTRMQE